MKKISIIALALTLPACNHDPVGDDGRSWAIRAQVVVGSEPQEDVGLKISFRDAIMRCEPSDDEMCEPANQYVAMEDSTRFTNEDGIARFLNLDPDRLYKVELLHPNEHDYYDLDRCRYKDIGRPDGRLYYANFFGSRKAESKVDSVTTHIGEDR